MTCDHCGALIADGLAHDVNARCDNCERPLRSQIPDTAPEGRLRDMPGAGGQPDMGGNPLREGILADNGWAHPMKRDESFASVKRADLDPNLQFEVTDVVPPDAKSIEAAHTVTLNLPHGLTDNLHTALDQSKAWVENPHDNGELCPYYKGYWRTIRPALERSSKLRIGVSDPKMAEILNHVAQTDDISPLEKLQQHQAGLGDVFKSVAPLAMAALPIAAAPFTGGASLALEPEAAGAGAAIAGGEAAAGAGEAATSAGGIGGLMKGALSAGKGLMNSGVGQAAQKGWDMAKGPLAVHEVEHDLTGGGGGGAPSGGGAGYGVGTVQPPSYFSSVRSHFLYADADLPNSNQGYSDTEDPEKVDQKERNDGEHDKWQKDDSENGMGGADSPFGPVFKDFADMLPTILKYFTSDEAGEGDPHLLDLHHKLDAAVPGYLDHADPHATHQFVLMLAKPGGDQPDADPENPTTAQDGDHKPGEVGEEHSAAVPNPQQPVGQQGWTDGSGIGTQTGHCPSCGSTISPGQSHCAQCGAGVGMAPGQQYSQPPTAEADVVPPGTPTGVQAKVAMDHPPYGLDEGVISGPMTAEEEPLQSGSWPRESMGTCPHCGQYTKFVLGGCAHCGATVADNPEGLKQYMASGMGPHTPQQIAAVQELLIQEGRVDEVTQVPIHPENYSDELARVQNVDSPPDGDLNNNPPEQPVEQTDPNAGMPVPGMSMDQSQQMATAALKYGADSVADACPKCGSHTTKVVSVDDGTTRCHTCNNLFKTHSLVPNDGGSSDISHTAAEEHGMTHMHPNPADVSAADYEHAEDPELEQDSSHTWKDENGEPLRVGQEYEMHSQKYDIPDVVRIEAVKPDSISYTITGQYGLEHSTEVTHQEALMDGLTFSPHQQDLDPNQEVDQDALGDQRQGPQPGDVTDLSQSHDMAVQSATEHSVGPDYSEDSMPCPDCGGPNPYHLPTCPSMQADANAQPQPPVDTRNIEKAFRLPTVEHPLGPQTGAVEDGVVHNDPALDWLSDRTAGAKFTPMEQREFIDEQGLARNADRLDLSNTHYIDREDDVTDHFLW